MYAGWLDIDLLDRLVTRLEGYGDHGTYGTSDRRERDGEGV